MKAYIIRSKPHEKNREREFKDGRISIGWPCGGSLHGKSRSEVSEILKLRYPDISEVGISMVSLFTEIPIGSIILTPSMHDSSLIHVFRTTSTYKYDKDADSAEKGNPHFLEATLLKTVLRKNLPLNVLQSLSGARKTLSKIPQHYDLLEQFINNDFELEQNPSRTGIVITMRMEAIDTFYSLLVNSKSESIRLSAARTIIEFEL